MMNAITITVIVKLFIGLSCTCWQTKCNVDVMTILCQRTLNVVGQQ